MKIYTKVVMQWRGDELVTVEEESFDYAGPVASAKGSDSGNQYYENLNRLYGMQADQAAELMGIARETVFPAYRDLVGQAQGYGSQANQEVAATRAAADSRAASGAAQQTLRDDLTSMGINPADARYVGAFANMGTQASAQEAAATTGARDRREQLGFARMQDAVSLGMGTPTQATSAANSAGNTAGTQLNAYNQQQSNQSNAVGNIVRAGVDLYGRGMADGGPVRGLRRAKGYVQRLAPGGIVGSMRNITPAAPPPSMPSASPVQQAIGPARTLSSAAGTQALGRGVSAAGDLTGSTYLSAAGKGIQSPGAVQPAIDAYRSAATQAVDGALPSAVPEAAAVSDAAATAVSDAAATAAAEGATEVAATDLAASAAGLETGAALGAAMPWVGGAMALYGIGNAAGWWADGGRVEPGAAGQTGEVDGPGGPKDDLIPAMLSDGEFVMPVGAVKFFGLDRLEKMRAKGLQYEKQLGIGG